MPGWGAWLQVKLNHVIGNRWIIFFRIVRRSVYFTRISPAAFCTSTRNHWIRSFIRGLFVWKKIYMRREFVLGFKAPVHTNPFWFENATFYLWIRLPSTRIRWKPSMKTELFENAHLSGTLWKHCFSVYVWTEQNGTFRKRWRHTISSKRWWTGASLSCLLSLDLFLTSNCLFSSKFSFVNSSSWLLQKVTEHYQVSYATGVKRRKVGSPFSLTFFLP